MGCTASASSVMGLRKSGLDDTASPLSRRIGDHDRVRSFAPDRDPPAGRVDGGDEEDIMVFDVFEHLELIYLVDTDAGS